ncbi:hypothetical protein H5T54_04715 [Candidatus Bipolaricaulota bacterium]|nr:hypothetical protein [Candidatus Bipolaricaulota bacterium]
MNEADPRANLVDPQLRAAGWTDREVTRGFYYQRDRQCALGRVILVGNEIRRGTPQSELPSPSHKSDLQRLEQAILDGAFWRSCDGV